MFESLKKKNDEIMEATFTCEREGLTIRGTEYRPQQAEEGEKLPIAIVSHGFMAFQDTVRHYAKALAKMGYASYCFDFCGGCVLKGKSDGKTTEMSVMTEVKDLQAVIAWARSRQGSHPSEIVLMGCSQGGFVSAITAARMNPEISKLVLFYPALCIPDDARSGKMMFAKFDPGKIPDVIPCGPMKLGRCYVEDVIRLDAFREIQGFEGDVLIVHGSRDSIVHPSYAKRAYETYQKENAEKNLSRKVCFHMIPDGAHGFSKEHDRIALNCLREFLKQEAQDCEAEME